jgi:hypothetical protein
MTDFYYIDLYMEPEDICFGDIVNGCVSALVGVGAQFEKIFMARHDKKQQISFGEHISVRPEDLGGLAKAYLEEYSGDKNFYMSFPHQGRIMFKYPFALDQSLTDEIRDEEEDTRSSAEALGLSFSYTQNRTRGNRVKASMSFWEEYHLTHSAEDIIEENVEKIISIVDAINLHARPYFGAMNPEINLNTDGSLELLRARKVPVGNEFVFIGKPLVHLLDREQTEAEGAIIRALSNEAMLIEFPRH